MLEVRREGDGELCGHVQEDGDDWLVLSVFGGVLRRCPTRDEATQAVLSEGLDALAAHWILSGPGVDGDQIVCIQDARPRSVTVALDYYSLPGVPTMTIVRADLDAGRFQLRLNES